MARRFNVIFNPMLSAQRLISGTPSVSASSATLVQTPTEPASSVVFPPATFAARFCMHRGITVDEFADAVFARALYPVASWLRPLLNFLPEYFAGDHAFIAMAGRATNMRDVESAIVDFADNRGKYRFLRKRLRLRVSASTVWMLANRFLKDEVASAQPPAPVVNSASPFPRERAGAPAAVTNRTDAQAEAGRASRASEEAEIARLRSEVARLAAQCELLKRAMGAFGDASASAAASR